MTMELPEIKSLSKIIGLMRKNQVHTLVYKRLAPNDNSKNQIYLGGNYSILQLLPFGAVVTDKSRKDSKRDRFKANLDFFWMDDEGKLFEAPGSQLILYPKYPEVRLSGFLQGSEYAPRDHLNSRKEGRVLLLGITHARHIVAHVIGLENPANQELGTFDTCNVLNEIYREPTNLESKHKLLEKLKEIHEIGWINSCKLDNNGITHPYQALNGGGYTIEAILGVTPNGQNEPDYLGWELKQHNAPLDKPLSGGAITLMTPEPTGGIYKTSGLINFVKEFGYPDTKGRENRYNFGGIHKFGERQNRTALTLSLDGYDINSHKIVNIEGGITLRSDSNCNAASWDFGSLLEKWNKKHAHAVYIPSQKRKSETIQYRYGSHVALGMGTDFDKFLHAVAIQSIYYDPGIKIENIDRNDQKSKKRSQFRIRPAKIPDLYQEMQLVDLINFE
ncbi:MvaI/BcnI family restriction endonuclease [Emcibacter sp.]|uniref:MvaI/BcnI family restriction endonuclease n=1 Tax=Emcibacter sp. TaxID=1979954 RepID=UPI003A92AC9E